MKVKKLIKYISEYKKLKMMVCVRDGANGWFEEVDFTLVYDKKEGKPFVISLVDAEALRLASDTKNLLILK